MFGSFCVIAKHPLVIQDPGAHGVEVEMRRDAMAIDRSVTENVRVEGLAGDSGGPGGMCVCVCGP